uniref:Transmembrane protein 151A n=1 Tax=Mus musculus TaxID=10090 RepID=D3Z5V1_MOUSE
MPEGEGGDCGEVPALVPDGEPLREEGADYSLPEVMGRSFRPPSQQTVSFQKWCLRPTLSGKPGDLPPFHPSIPRPLDCLSEVKAGKDLAGASGLS